jgi:hypothetical protein
MPRLRSQIDKRGADVSEPEFCYRFSRFAYATNRRVPLFLKNLLELTGPRRLFPHEVYWQCFYCFDRSLRG